ncbi:hypothetical protein IV203_028847 [Nitzschia inconspicua]|uniref:Uncharacterized protein n=1 Tax=Nitzschia inconspicua TaxID=303405 RepID=A0A9K3K7X4_9STRA|nr:hypothetical protein IV203_004782 [Nitzschia inconspicua]KAG7366177.1 hypothetical protein IV203_028847 [Nitzschia inconspicua]
MAGKEEPELRVLVRKCAAIPFDVVCGKEFDLMMAATIRPNCGGASFVPMHAGFTTKFFNQMKSSSGVQELKELLDSADIYQQQDLIGLHERKTASSGHGSVNLLNLFGGSGKGASSFAVEDVYSITEIKVSSLNNSLYLMPFIQKNMQDFISCNPAMVQKFAAKPTPWRGSVDQVLAFIITKVTGKARLHHEGAQEMSGEASAVASMPASAGAGAEASAGFAHASSVKDVQNVQESILGASYMLVHLRKTVSSNDVEIKHTSMVQRDDDPELYAFLSCVKLKEFRSLVTGRRNAPLGFLTESKSTMGEHATLDDHVAIMQRDAQSLAIFGWNEETGLVNLKSLADSGSGMLLCDDDRLGEGGEGWDLMAKWFGSWNHVFSAPRGQLSKMYQTLKKEGSVKVCGLTVVAMSPTFKVETSGFLPIYHQGGTPTDEAPGAVVRDFEGFVFIFPVEGCNDYKSCITCTMRIGKCKSPSSM